MSNLFSRIWNSLKHVLPQAPTAAGEQLREVAKPTLTEAADQANRTLDHAAQHGHKLLADAEVSRAPNESDLESEKRSE